MPLLTKEPDEPAVPKVIVVSAVPACGLNIQVALIKKVFSTTILTPTSILNVLAAQLLVKL